ncbi:Ankyrin repeat-containing domain [Pseudocohnilembus persalinus]|uniref:Ankyrin repeat-containing domain n=1 Tax=Pseudocohnilembus persalinus TaxID=266149 RepID=A0A0V0QJI4_PSEPJ|nr:Ankyrin repeat-containing domain [Pseudocohnilembus persalinus]|eukprot:KRX02280.1 Ankyrin repeat-containing domain [Pseudocohnilembus persalinus]
MISLSAILRLKHRIPLELRSQASQGVVSTKVGDRLGSPRQSTGSHQNSEVKRLKAWLVLRWGTAWEVHYDFVVGHTKAKAPDPIRTPKLSVLRRGQYQGGGPLGKSTQNLLKYLKNDDTERILEALQGQENIKIYDKKGYSPLHIVIDNQNSTAMKYLIKVIDQEELYYSTKSLEEPLFYCIKLGFWEGVDILLENNVDPNKPDKNGTTPLQYAAKLNTYLPIKSLIRYKADINQYDKNGTALHYAIQVQANEVANYLIEKSKELDFDFTIQNEDGDTVLHLATIEGMGIVVQQIVEFFKENNLNNKMQALSNLKNNQGNTILHEAYLHKRNVIIQYLNENQEFLGIDQSLTNNQNKTAKQIQEEVEIKIKQEKEQLQEEKQQIKQEIRKRHEVEREMIKEMEQQAIENQKELEQALLDQQKLNMENQKKYRFFTIVTIFFILYAVYIGLKIVNNEI